jgi:hypothetical protein
MLSLLGIEVSRSACRIVELDRLGPDDVATTVRSYSQSTAADATSLAPFRGRQAALVVWGLHGEYRQAVVTSASYQRMRREAVSATRQAGVETRQMLADIAPIGEKGAPRRTVVVALARTNNVAAALRAFTSAGVKVRSIVTPALALMSLARMRCRLARAGSADMAEAFVAIEDTTTAIALMRDGALVAARELDWGYRSAAGVRSREDAARRLGDAIEGFLGDCGVRASALSQICVCGGMPELRNVTLPLMERFDVEVEPLDSLFGIDADHLPEPADDFRERVVGLRLAWAVAADWHAPINFLRERRRRTVKTVLTRAAVVAGVATGVALAWRAQRSELFQPGAPLPKTPAPTRPSAARPELREAPPAAAAIAEPAIAPPSSPPVSASSLAQAPTQESPRAPEVVLTPVAPRAAQGPPPVTARNEPSAPPPIASLPRPSDTVTRRPPVEETPLPFDGSLGTILYGSDRKLAMVDGRIVQVGDDVRGARVIDILPDAVLFRDVQGHLRKLTLQDSRR